MQTIQLEVRDELLSRIDDIKTDKVKTISSYELFDNI